MKKGLKLLLISSIIIVLLTILTPKVHAAETHMVTFVTGVEDIIMDPFEVEDGDTINDKGIDFYPHREGYSYPVWYTDPEFQNEFDFETKFYESTTLYAKWLISIDEVRITTDITSLTVGEMLPEYSFSSTTEHVTFGNAIWDGNDVGDIVDAEKEYALTISAKADDGYELDGAALYINGEYVSEWIAWPLSMGGDEIGGTFYITIEVNPSLEIIKATDTYTIGESNEAEFEINADYSLFEQGGKVYIDGDTNPLDPSNYTSRSGSTIITLNKEYVNTLSEGKHILKVVFNDNKAATTSFTITKKTPTKDVHNATNNATNNTVIQPPHTGMHNSATGERTLIYLLMLVLSIVGLYRKVNR